MFVASLIKSRDMNRIHNIIIHPAFTRALQDLARIEKDSPFCRHDLPHLLDTARIAYIISLEKWNIHSKDVIYAAALLHDIGRVQEYETGIPHDEAGAEMSVPILQDCGYTAEETEQIVLAIRHHREQLHADSLGALLFEADKASRCCFNCPVRDRCSWTPEQKNDRVRW